MENMKYQNKILFFLMVVVFVFICFTVDIKADDKRKGLMGDIGIGIAYTELALSSGEKDTSIGPCFSARLGYGFNEHIFLYAGLRESVYFSSNKWTDTGTHHAGLLYGLGVSYFFNDTPDSMYITAAYGIGDLDNGGDSVDDGEARLFGVGYLASNHFAFEISFLNTSVNEEGFLESDFDADSIRLTVRYMFY